ncbi:hypothetical protein COU15_00670 [Candidatus Kaiserbacteria bacterium CG10_big_fil_rev_8_21_14_0_10_45_20]|uniref:Uncharacterized protein n=1 Tax=Candidatus Kaiserbacteria bacterium CG10_big_fil_rev_8_21_14_0_10_45_20 TaxID=1974607 RepID=A0A2H0UI16_9BACT|nr:MAG: hypothetical protein COU15_00670 [Candidatus Kaiserbacteria bacterium CG10_big_fil_rev_8_21_14_0_10_45_20]
MKNTGLLVVIALILGIIIGYFVLPSPVAEAPENNSNTDNTVCIQVITPARNPETREIREFPTPCDVPSDWEIIRNEIPQLELETN